jgi:hypothetical protein
VHLLRHKESSAGTISIICGDGERSSLSVIEKEQHREFNAAQVKPWITLLLHFEGGV